MPTNRALALILLALSSIASAAQNHFTASLTSSQEVPPNASPGIGFARASVNAAENQLTVTLHFAALGSNVTAGHVHGPAAAGVNGPVLFNLSPPTGVTVGSVVAANFAISAPQLADLRAGLHYVNLHTSGLPGGEIRGQLLPAAPILAPLDAGQVVPPTASTASGFGRVFVKPATNQLLASISWSGLSAPATMGHIHAAASGVNGPIICNLSPAHSTSGSRTDVLCTLTAPNFNAVMAGGAYFDLHNSAFPDGEIRGQIDGLLIDGFE